MIGVALAAARSAGEVIRARRFGDYRRKGAVDLVTDVDLAAEEAIRRVLARETPQIPVLAEEGGGAETARTRWIVDPLDGTTNFIHGYPVFCVSVALQLDGVLEAGCVYDPVHDSAYTAVRGRGAMQDDRPLAVSPAARLEDALLATGFPYDRRTRPGFYLGFVEAFLMRGQGIRRSGSAAMDLCQVAAGRVDGFWEFNLRPWDIAAGILLVEEAGGRTSGMDGSPADLDHGSIVATNGALHGDMLEVISAVLGGGAAGP